MTSAADFMRQSIDMEPPCPCRGHMPFKGHRTQAGIIEAENRHRILSGLGRPRRKATRG